jgi:Tol biopolymer transport system component
MPTTTFKVEDLCLEQRVDDLHAVAALDVVVCAVKRVERHANDYRSALWLYPLDGSAVPRQLTAGKSNDKQPHWSPDGKRIAFLSDRAGTIQIFLIDPDGGEARQISFFKGTVTAFEWKPDGSQLLLTTVVNVDPDARGAPSQLDEERDPDAPEVVWRLPYKLNGAGYLLDREIHLYTLDVDTGEEHRLTCGAFDVRAAVWSPDGCRIAYSRTREAHSAHATDLWVVDADGGNPRQLTHEQPNIGSLQWSPDGRWVVFTGNCDDGDAHMQLWLADVNSGRTQILGDEDIEVVPGTTLYWDPDSTQVRVLIAKRGRQHLERALLHKSGGGRVSPDPRRIYATATVWGVPSRVKRFSSAARICSSAT